MAAFNDYIQPHSALLRMENPPDAAVLMGIQGISKVDFLSDRQVRVYFDSDEEVTERLVAASVQQGWRLREISLDKGLLDDVFKQLSTQSHS
jgi:ABC-2 type transport system ATP-binding protein